MMSQNEFGDGISVDKDWFRMLWQHSNTMYGKTWGACVVSCDIRVSGM